MASALPHRPTVDHAPREQTDVVLGRDEPTDALRVLSCDTAQRILAALADGPGTASDVAADVDASLQNVTYHLNRLCDADLIAPVNTWYSEKGKEMTVYAPTVERIVVRIDAPADRSPTKRDRP
ncbi:transcriptional regulator [Halorubrum sp. Ib24]|uniref:ArsR/SmtB family transcription factor n=1 Tax=Halorubrum sp. Ib24 TaxID=1383850 RepID=UPI000B98A300|nr:winged helix-turn-helix domain-containing protein [Halorubrum sp. Ib24]OYR40924.1 transcriptional regulator [Halorubrum sp. Ib24]